MGWIKENKGDKDVKGIIIAGEFDKKMGYAMDIVPNIEVFTYKVNFKLEKFEEND